MSQKRPGRGARHREPGNPPTADPIMLEVELTQGASDMIDQLLDHGIFGVTREEVAERLICRGLEDLASEEDFIILDDDDD